MKKLIAILIAMIALVGAVFAANNDTLVLNATVATVYPVFSIFGGKTSAETSTEGTQSGAAITFTAQEKNLAVNDITVYFRLYQNNKAKYKGTATLTITATPLTNTDNTIQGTKSTEAPTAAHVQATQNLAGISYAQNATPSSASSNGNTVVTFAPVYDGRTVQATDIGTFDLTWGHDDDLPAGSYQATITLAFTPV